MRNRISTAIGDGMKPPDRLHVVVTAETVNFLLDVVQVHSSSTSSVRAFGSYCAAMYVYTITSHGKNRDLVLPALEVDRWNALHIVYCRRAAGVVLLIVEDDIDKPKLDAIVSQIHLEIPLPYCALVSARLWSVPGYQIDCSRRCVPGPATALSAAAPWV